MPRVLVAEDDPDIANLLAHYLQRAGFDAETVQSGRDVLPRVKKAPPDLLLLDLLLPGLDGLEVCRAVREDDSLADTGVIMLTGIGERLNEMTSPLYGADDFLDKPFDLGELDTKIRVVLEKRREER